MTLDASSVAKADFDCSMDCAGKQVEGLEITPLDGAGEEIGS